MSHINWKRASIKSCNVLELVVSTSCGDAQTCKCESMTLVIICVSPSLAAIWHDKGLNLEVFLGIDTKDQGQLKLFREERNGVHANGFSEFTVTATIFVVASGPQSWEGMKISASNSILK